MKKNRKSYLSFLFYFVSLIIFLPEALSKDNLNFLSLKNNEVNLRQGPSFEYPIILIYKKKHLPVLILDKSHAWRKIKDFQNNVGWIHISQLSKKKSALNIKSNSLLYKNSTIYSKPIAKLESGRLVLINKCNATWCKITSGDFNGWINKSFLWGNIN